MTNTKDIIAAAEGVIFRTSHTNEGHVVSSIIAGLPPQTLASLHIFAGRQAIEYEAAPTEFLSGSKRAYVKIWDALAAWADYEIATS